MLFSGGAVRRPCRCLAPASHRSLVVVSLGVGGVGRVDRVVPRRCRAERRCVVAQPRVDVVVVVDVDTAAVEVAAVSIAYTWR